LISLFALVPFAIIVAMLMAVFYGTNGGRAITGSTGGDAATWVASFITFYGVTFGSMMLPWPGVPAK
jgi:hypothetical protein